jgi:hypothetical protein
MLIRPKANRKVPIGAGAAANTNMPKAISKAANILFLIIITSLFS